MMTSKQVFTFRMKEETSERIERLYRKEGSHSRTEFIEKAIHSYCDLLETMIYASVLSKEIQSAWEETNLLLTQQAVEQSVLISLLIPDLGLSQEQLDQLRSKHYESIISGKVQEKFEQIRQDYFDKQHLKQERF